MSLCVRFVESSASGQERQLCKVCVGPCKKGGRAADRRGGKMRVGGVQKGMEVYLGAGCAFTHTREKGDYRSLVMSLFHRGRNKREGLCSRGVNKAQVLKFPASVF